MGNLGFSYKRLIFLLMLFIPNILWSKNKSKGYSSGNENRILLAFERVGQVLVTIIALIFEDFNIKNIGYWNIWLILAFITMILYEICWLRYFKNPTNENFYKNFFFISVPLATLPIVAFFLLGIYGKVVWMIISITILGIGHIGIHLGHLKDIKST